jgi:hypothetical protein
MKYLLFGCEDAEQRHRRGRRFRLLLRLGWKLCRQGDWRGYKRLLWLGQRQRLGVVWKRVRRHRGWRRFLYSRLVLELLELQQYIHMTQTHVCSTHDDQIMPKHRAFPSAVIHFSRPHFSRKGEGLTESIFWTLSPKSLKSLNMSSFFIGRTQRSSSHLPSSFV